jgi:tetratricopeptide (TPR) repeat protein
VSELELWNELGNVYFNTGAYDQAVHAYKRAIQLDPDFGWAYSNLAQAYVHQNQYTEAIPIYIKSLELLQDGKDKAESWNRLGTAYRQLRDYPNALAAYQKAVEFDGTNVLFKEDLGRIYHDLGDLYESLANGQQGSEETRFDDETVLDRNPEESDEWSELDESTRLESDEDILLLGGTLFSKEELAAALERDVTVGDVESTDSDAQATISENMVTGQKDLDIGDESLEEISDLDSSTSEDTEDALGTQSLEDEGLAELTLDPEALAAPEADESIEVELLVDEEPTEGETSELETPGAAELEDAIIVESVMDGEQPAEEALDLDTLFTDDTEEVSDALLLADEPVTDETPSVEVPVTSEMGETIGSEQSVDEESVTEGISGVEEPGEQELPTNEAPDTEKAQDMELSSDDITEVDQPVPAEEAQTDTAEVVEQDVEPQTDQMSQPQDAEKDSRSGDDSDETEDTPETNAEYWKFDDHNSSNGNGSMGGRDVEPQRQDTQVETLVALDEPVADERAESRGIPWVMAQEEQIVESSQDQDHDVGQLNKSEELEKDIAKFKRVVEINPGNAFAWDTLGGLYKAKGRYAEAISAFEQAVVLSPDKSFYHYHLGLVYAAQKRYDEAIHAFESVIKLDPQYSLAHATLAGYYRKLDRESDAQNHIRIAQSLMRGENEYNRACFEAICGNADQAVELLKVALDKKQTPMDWAKRDPDLDFIREDPRYLALVENS